MENFRSPQEQQPIQLQLYELFVKDTKMTILQAIGTVLTGQIIIVADHLKAM